MSTLGTIKQFAREDTDNICSSLKKKYGLNADVKSMDFDCDESELENSDSASCVVEVEYIIDGRLVTVDYEYATDGDDILTGGNTEDWIEDTYIAYTQAQDIEESTDTTEPVTAADADIEEEPSNLSDTLDDIADSVEDVQDQISDIDEDEPSIEIDNNIDGHYIAECERCHGIFISAVLENDQGIDHLTGICPICDHESNQYLRWVIKSLKD